MFNYFFSIEFKYNTAIETLFPSMTGWEIRVYCFVLLLNENHIKKTSCLIWSSIIVLTFRVWFICSNVWWVHFFLLIFVLISIPRKTLNWRHILFGEFWHNFKLKCISIIPTLLVVPHLVKVCEATLPLFYLTNPSVLDLLLPKLFFFVLNLSDCTFQLMYSLRSNT